MCTQTKSTDINVNVDTGECICKRFKSNNNSRNSALNIWTIFERDLLSGLALFRFLSVFKQLPPFIRWLQKVQQVKQHKKQSKSLTTTTKKEPTRTNHNKNLHAFVHMRAKKKEENYVGNQIGLRQISVWVEREKCRWWFLCVGFLPKFVSIEHIDTKPKTSTKTNNNNKMAWFAWTLYIVRNTRKMQASAMQCQKSRIHQSSLSFLFCSICICMNVVLLLLLLRLRDSTVRCHCYNICCCQRNKIHWQPRNELDEDNSTYGDTQPKKKGTTCTQMNKKIFNAHQKTEEFCR